MFAPNLKLHHLLYADITVIHKIIFPSGSDVGFISLDDLLSINFLSVDAASAVKLLNWGSKEDQGLCCRRLLSFSSLARPRDFFLRPKKQTGACYLDYYKRSDLDKVDQSQKKKITIHSKEAGCGPINSS